MQLKQLAETLKPKFIDEFLKKPCRPCRIFLSATDMKSRAVVRHASDIDPNAAFGNALEQLSAALESNDAKILRADWIIDAEAMTWQDFNNLIGKTRRNYFKRGVALRPDFSIAFTELELNANLMFFDGQKSKGAFNADNADAYCRARFNRDFPKLNPSDPVAVFETNGAFVIEGEEAQSIEGAEHRHVSPLDSDQILSMVRNGAQHLARQIQPDGRFVYGLFPCDDRVVPSYNTLRHFSSIFAMLDVYETYEPTERNEELRQAIIRGLDYAVKHFVRWRQLPDGTQAAYIEEPSGKEFKLGALGVPIVALAKFSELMRTQKYFPLMRALARGLMTMQQPDGSFVHVLNSTDFTVKEPFRIVYYDGEAVFGMMKLYSLTHDPKLLEASKLAFKRFIATDHWKNHDHWLSYAVNELTKYEPRKELFEFGIKNFSGHLHFVYHRDTQYPTLMELMMAADTMLERMKSMPEMAELLSTVNFDDFYAAMEARAANMLNAYFYPELSMFFARPESIVGAFFMRHHEFRARNDDIEHFLSGFAAYRRYLEHRTGEPKPSAELLNEKSTVDKPLDEPIVDKKIVDKPIVEKNIRPSGTAEIFFGGIINIGRRMHWRVNEVEQFGDIPAMRNADLRLAELIGTASTIGEYQKDKGNYFYFRARPEQLNILTAADIDVVLTANHHSGDYGSEALLDQNNKLNNVGIRHAGAGINFEEASRPTYVKANDLIVAIFSVDATTKVFAADNNSAGTFYLPPDDIELWKATFNDKIADARKHADIVFVAVDWELNNSNKPSEQLQNIGHALIDCGADAVLGSHSYLLNQVENYNERPIIYGAGVFLFDGSGGESDSGCFTLTVDNDGVQKINFIALRRGNGYVLPANDKEPISIAFNPTPRGAVGKIPIELPTVEKKLIKPLMEPRPEWTVESVPDEALISPMKFGPLTMVGYRVPPESRTLTQRGMIFVETYWILSEPIEQNCRLQILGVPLRECRMGTFGSGMIHDFCDWQYPTERWKQGVIYHERLGLRPSSRFSNIDIRIEIRVQINGKFSKPFIDPQLIKIDLKNLPQYRTEFPNAIYKSKPGQCWNAEQLAAVTGGKWIVPPPKGWFIQSIAHHFGNVGAVKPPTLFITASRAQFDFHNQVTPSGEKTNNYSQIASRAQQIAGAVVDHKIEDLPEDFPQLLVDDPVKAAIEIGFAARKRFQGKMIGVTGTNGKTTTCAILKHVLEQEHSVEASYSSINTKLGVPIIFANVKQEDAFAVIEISINAMHSMRGAITYDIPPHIAVVTSIFEVHLSNSGSLADIARSKSLIFNGMAPGGYAVLNRDMNYYEVFEQKARSKELNIITFGTHPESMIRMNPIANGGTFEFNGKTYTLECPVPNEQLYDALAVVGVSIASGYSIEKTLEYLKTFKTVKGRGNLIDTTFNGKKLRLIDSTYNANIASIIGTLSYLETLEPDPSKRVAFLGDVAELGDESVRLHLNLVEPILKAKPDRIVLIGDFMKHVWDQIKDKLNGAWFPNVDDSLPAVDDYVRDGDTVLLKSSHSTQLDKIVKKLSTEKAKSVTPPAPSSVSTPIEPTLNAPSALFDVKDFLPEGITPELNGRMPMDRMMKVDCGGLLYVDAARSFNAMTEAAERDGVFLRVNNPFNCYRTFQTQEKVFKQRLKPIGDDNPPRAGAIRVEFENQIWQLNEGEAFAQVPGQSSHSYGLAVDIQNVGVRATRDWLNANAAQFGFVREFDFEDWHYTYVKSKEGIPARVLEIETLPPAKTWTADQIVEASGCQWYGAAPSSDWSCRGLLSAQPLKTKRLAVIDQGSGIGLNANVIRLIFRQCAGIICTQPDELLKYKKPLLVTANIVDTVNRLENLFR